MRPQYFVGEWPYRSFSRAFSSIFGKSGFIDVARAPSFRLTIFFGFSDLFFRKILNRLLKSELIGGILPPEIRGLSRLSGLINTH